MVNPAALADLVELLHHCVCTALDDVASRVPGQPGCPCFSCPHAGQPAWDSCCSCLDAGRTGGQLNVWLERIYPTTRFPEPVVEPHACLPAGTGVAADLVVTLLRCAPTLDEEGLPPTCDDLAATARIVHTDMLPVFSAVSCCLPTAGNAGRKGRKVVIREHRTIGPEGGCGGSEPRVAVETGIRCLCPDGGTSP